MTAPKPVGWITPTGQLFPLHAYRPEQKLAYDGHKAGWRHVVVGEDILPKAAGNFTAPTWGHVQAAFIEGARECYINPTANDDDFKRAADGYTKRVFEEVDPESERLLRTNGFPLTPAMRADAEAIGACCDPLSLEVGDPA